MAWYHSARRKRLLGLPPKGVDAARFREAFLAAQTPYAGPTEGEPSVRVKLESLMHGLRATARTNLELHTARDEVDLAQAAIEATEREARAAHELARAATAAERHGTDTAAMATRRTAMRARQAAAEVDERLAELRRGTADPELRSASDRAFDAMVVAADRGVTQINEYIVGYLNPARAYEGQAPLPPLGTETVEAELRQAVAPLDTAPAVPAG